MDEKMMRLHEVRMACEQLRGCITNAMVLMQSEKRKPCGMILDYLYTNAGEAMYATGELIADIAADEKRKKKNARPKENETRE